MFRLILNKCGFASGMVVLIAGGCLADSASSGHPVERQVPAVRPIDHAVDLNIRATSLRQLVREMRRSDSFKAVVNKGRESSRPLVILYEGRESGLNIIPVANGNSGEMHAKHVPPPFRLINPVVVHGRSLKEAVEIAVAGTDVSVATNNEGNFLLFSDTELPKDERWPLNRRLETDQQLTFSEAEQLLRDRYGYEAPPVPSGRRMRLFQFQGDEVVWDGSKRDGTVRDLLHAMLEVAITQRMTSKSFSSTVGYQLIPSDEDVQGNLKWSVNLF